MLQQEYELPLEKLRMVPPGYDDTRFYPVGQSTRELLRKRLGFTGKVVLSLGRLARNNGYDLLIRAFQELATREPEARLYLAIGGERPEPREQAALDECRSLVQALGLHDVVTFAGFVPDAELGVTTLKVLKHRKLAERLSLTGAHTARSLCTWTGVAQQILAAFEDRATQRVSVSEFEPAPDWFGPEEQG